MNNPIDTDLDITDLENAVIEEFCKEVSDRIDFEIYSGLMCDLLGWTLVEIWHNEWAEVDEWLGKNCKFEYKRNGYKIIFEDLQDANWCKLRWL